MRPNTTIKAVVLIGVATCCTSCDEPSEPVTRATSQATIAVPPAPGDYYLTMQGLCADLGSEHASDTHENVHRVRCNGSVFQRWSIKSDPNREGRFLVEWFNHSNKYWTAENFSPNATHLTFDPRRDSAFQSWVFTQQPDGSYQIKNDGVAKCVNFDPNGGPDIRLSSACSGGSAVLQAVQ